MAYALNPGASIVGDSRENTSVFSRCREPGRPNRFPTKFRERKRSSYEVRDSFEKFSDGIGSTAGVQCLRSHEGKSGPEQPDNSKRDQAESRRIQTRVGWQRT